jgi:hypothetical protein
MGATAHFKQCMQHLPVVKNVLPSHLMPHRFLFHNKWRVQAKNDRFIAVGCFFSSLCFSFPP